MSETNDYRSDKTEAAYWCIGQVRYLATYAGGPKRKLAAWACTDYVHAELTAAWLRHGRLDFYRVRTTSNLPRLRQDDALLLYDGPPVKTVEPFRAHVYGADEWLASHLPTTENEDDN